MGDKENKPPMYLLMPKCTDTKHDAFFNILRNLISRPGRNSSDQDHALKYGMTGKSFSIERDDIADDWECQQTTAKQIVQWKLLGFWANGNSPCLGKKLFQPTWKPPQRESVEVVGDRSMTPDEIDGIIAKKINLRVYELCMSQSTKDKLKHLVVVPADVHLCNDVQISPKIRMFEIEHEHVKRCFDALRLGKFEDSIGGNVEQPMRRVPSTSVNTFCQQNLDNIAQEVSMPLSTFSRQISDTNSGNGLQSAKRARMDINVSDTVSEPGSGMVLVEIQKKLDNLTQWLDHGLADRDGGNGSERLHVMIFRQKDNEISQLRMEIINLKMEKSNLEEKVMVKSELINALKKGAESSSELWSKTESEYQKTVQTLKCELQSAKNELAAREREIEQLSITIQSNVTENSKLADQLNKLDGNVKNVPVLERQNQDLQAELSETEAVNGKLKADVSEWKNIAAAKEHKIEQLHETIQLSITDKTKLEAQLNALNETVKDILPDLERQSACLQAELSEAMAANGKLKADVSEWKNIAAAKEHKVEQLHETIQLNITDKTKLEGQLNALNETVKDILPDLERQSAFLQAELSEAMAANGKLKADVSDWKNIAATKEHEIEQLHETIQLNITDKTKLEGQLNALNERVLPDLERQSAYLQAELSEAMAANGKLKADVNEWKNIAATKEHENEQLQEMIQLNITEKAKLEKQLNELNAKVLDIKPELHRRIEESQTSWVEATNENMKLQEEVRQSKSCDPQSRDCTLEENAMEHGNGSDYVSEPNDLKTTVKMPLESSSCIPEASGRLPETLECRNELEEIRENVKKLKFGWIKFYDYKSCVPVPGFKYPRDKDGVKRAQKITAKGSVCVKTYEYFHYYKNIPDSEKLSCHKTALKKFNEKFHFNFV